MIKTWKCFESSLIEYDETSIADILEEPLFFNPVLINPKTEEPYYFEHFVLAGITEVKDLMDLTNNRKYSSSEFVDKINIRSERCLQQHLDLQWSSLPLEWTNILYRFSNGDINIGTKHQYILRLDLENSSDLSRGVILNRSPNKLLYFLSVILNFNNSRIKKSLSPWNSILNTDIPPNEIYGHVYEKHHSMHEGDINWGILHGAISTAKFCFRSGYERSDLYPYCGKQEDLTHLFLSCKKIEPLVHHVQSILEYIIPDTAFY